MWQNIVEERSCLYRELENSKPERSRDAERPETKGNQPKMRVNPVCVQEPARATETILKSGLFVFSQISYPVVEGRREEKRGETHLVALPCRSFLPWQSVAVGNVTPAAVWFASKLPELSRSFITVIPSCGLSQQCLVSGTTFEKVPSTFVILGDV